MEYEFDICEPCANAYESIVALAAVFGEEPSTEALLKSLCEECAKTAHRTICE